MTSMAPKTHAFVPCAPLRPSVWTGVRVAASSPTHLLRRQPLSTRATTTMAFSAESRRLRHAFILSNRSSPIPSASSFPSPLPSPDSPHPSSRLSAACTRPSALAAAFIRPARTALAFAARLSRRSRNARRRHAFALQLARMGLGLGLAAVSYFVTRGALSGVATVPTAPVLPQWPSIPFKVNLPPRLREVIKPFTEAFGVVFLSEFGDKSMFATALMAMKHSPLIVCVGALAALTVMTFIACFLGQLMHLLPATVTHYSTIALFVFFGLQMIMQSRHLPDTPGGAGGERADAEEMVAQAAVAKVQSPLAVLAKVSSLIFVAEWCDRSMLATMALAASSNTVAVIGGATFANIICTGVAVGGAAVVASKISERMVALVAGIMFEFFAVFTYFEGPEG